MVATVQSTDTSMWHFLVLVDVIVVFKNLLIYYMNINNVIQHMHLMVEVMLINDMNDVCLVN